MTTQYSVWDYDELYHFGSFDSIEAAKGVMRQNPNVYCVYVVDSNHEMHDSVCELTQEAFDVGMVESIHAYRMNRRLTRFE